MKLKSNNALHLLPKKEGGGGGERESGMSFLLICFYESELKIRT